MPQNQKGCCDVSVVPQRCVCLRRLERRNFYRYGGGLDDWGAMFVNITIIEKVAVPLHMDGLL
jgi:hypothetical protein